MASSLSGDLDAAPELANELGISRSEARMAISTGRVAEYRLRAERDRLREALERIAAQAPASDSLVPGVPWRHWREIAREALDG